MQRAISKLSIPVITYSLKSAISTFHTMKIIIPENSMFLFVGSIPESMYQCVSGASKLIGEYQKHIVLGTRILTPKVQETLDEVDKIKKGGKPT